MKVLVTGADGFIGVRVQKELEAKGHECRTYDLPNGNVLDTEQLEEAADGCNACIHLAAHKYAGSGEEKPADVAHLNIQGTVNVAKVFGNRFVLASTCKAADAMTCYGASKLIAERITLNAGARVVRLVNVLASTGSVIDIWRQIPHPDPIPVMDCERIWMHGEVAAKLFVAALAYPTGRYAPKVGPARHMNQIARSIHPQRKTVDAPLRRGDRPVERLVAEYERAEPYAQNVVRIIHPADLPAIKRVAA